MNKVFFISVFLAFAAVQAYAQDGSGMNNTSNLSNMSNTSGMGAGTTDNMTGSSGMGNASSMNNTTNGTMYGMGVNKNETDNKTGAGENDTGMGAGLGNETGGKGDGTGAGNTSTDGSGMSAGMSLMTSYSYEQKDQMIKEVENKIGTLSDRIKEAKRGGDNETARILKKDQGRLKKQVGVLKDANRNNWEKVQKETQDMLQQMDLA